jgi:hypothetical protein
MGKQAGPDYITGTVGDRTYYRLNGQYLVRAKSTLSRKRVKRSPAFRRTMEYAGWLAAASKLAAEVYRMMPKEERKVQEYREMTGRAMDLIRQGMDAGVVKERLVKQYLKKAKPVKRIMPVVVRVHKVVPLFCTGHSILRRRTGIKVRTRRKQVCKRE